MSKAHPLKSIVQSQKDGIARGIYSACSANDYVIEACMEVALKNEDYVLIEATANQVNQFGGYTGMKPSDFRDFVYRIAKRAGFSYERIILGGDHLGPLTWKNEDSSSALEKSRQLVQDYVSAGFTKIHIDTSMHLRDDDLGKRLDTAIIAKRGAYLCNAAEEAYERLKEKQPDALSPVYVVGSEVPIPGGSQQEEGIQITKAQDFEETVETFKDAFFQYGLEKAWENVIAVVVQPGVEFGNETIHEFNREKAKELCNALKKYPNLVFEGHSTDYQTADSLRQMVEGGIAILKVGPALTFALREALFALNYMEKELFKYSPEVQLSNFIETLEAAMVKQPENWMKHYQGDAVKIRYARKYSLSDRARYYLPMIEVRDAMEQMIGNLKSVDIPLTLIDQHMPIQYKMIRNGNLAKDPESLIKGRIANWINDYIYAVKPEKVMKDFAC